MNALYRNGVKYKLGSKKKKKKCALFNVEYFEN